MKKYLSILLFFILFSTPAFAIKIGLTINESSVQISASEEAQVIDVKTNKQLCIIRKMLMYEITPVDDKSMIVRSNYGQCTIYSNDVVVKPLDEHALVYTKGRWYRGILRILNKNSLLTVINDVCIENYIQSVLPSEMPSSWNIEALKAQAVAARTYAVANIGKHSKDGFDLVDTQMDQVYLGVSSETENTNNAVLDTLGLVMIYNNKPISAMYFSAAGGQTRSSHESLNDNLPYLKSVKSFDDDITPNGHGIGMSQHGAKNLAQMGNDFVQILTHFYTDISFAKLNQIYYK